jgi:chitodextrinase
MRLKYAICSFFLILMSVGLHCGQIIDSENEIQQLNNAPQNPVGIPPALPTNFISTSASADSVTIAWEKSFGKIPVAYYEVQTDSSIDPMVVDGNATSATVTGLSESRSYDIRIRSCDAGGVCSAYSQSLSVSTISRPDVTAPTVPSLVFYTGRTTTTIQLGWSVSTDNVGVARYNIQVGTNATLITVDAPTSTRLITGLSPATTYVFKVQACDASNNCSAFGTASIATIAAPDTTAPTVPTNLASPSKTTTTVNLSWTASTDAVGVTSYEIRTNSAGTPISVMAPATTKTMSGLTAATAYQFQIRACDAATNCSAYSANISVTTMSDVDATSPSVPTNLAASNQTASAITLNWTASTDNIAVNRYEIRTNSTGTPVSVSAPTVTRIMSGLTIMTTYQFQVRACDAANNCSAYTSNISASTLADTTIPSVPTNLVASGQTSSAITLNWTASTDNVAVNRYEIRTNSTGTPVSVTAPTTTRVMSGLTAATTYQFQVRACDAANNCSAYTSNINATTLSNTPSPDVTGCSSTIRTFTNTASSRKTVPLCANVFNSPAKITLQWSNISGVTRSSMSVYRRSVGATSWGTAIATPTASGNTWSDTTVSAGTKYEYRVQATTSAGEANGYIVSGIKVAAADYEGKVILVVDNTFQSTLASEILNLQNDFRKKGWIPKTIYVSRTDSATNVKTQITNLYNMDPTNTKAAFLLGHVPVPYSGTAQWPDGHDDHRGAWVADGYYGDLNGTWTAGGGNVWYFAQGPNANSKFSQNTFPSDMELTIGRVDMSALSGSLTDPFGNVKMGFTRTETQLLSDYLSRLHNFKDGTVVPARKAIIDSDVDNDGYVVTPGSYSSFSTSIDPNNIDQIAAGASPNFIGQIHNDNYLWANATGYATGIGMITNGNITESIASNIGAVFIQTFGSYFGDFDTRLNFLRGLIGNDSGHTSLALTHIYSGYKHLYAHSMAMGDTIGNAWKVSTRNTDSNYKPYRVDDQSYWAGETYFSLMGDPTLTLFHPKGPSNLVVNNGSGNFTLSWTAPSGGANGYYVYEITENASGSASTEKIQKIGTKITGTTSPTISGSPTGRKFLVRAIRDEVTASGTYENLSLGITN